MSAEIKDLAGKVEALYKDVQDTAAQKWKEQEEKGMATGQTLEVLEKKLDAAGKKYELLEKRIARQTNQSEEKSSLEAEFKSVQGSLLNLGRTPMTDVDQYSEVKSLMDKFFRKGASGLTHDEMKSINGVVDPDGGYLVAPERSTTVGKRRFNDRGASDSVAMQTISTNMWKEPFDNSPYSDTVWEDQITATGSDLGNNAFKEISISVGDAYYPKQFSRSSLEDAYVNLDSHVMGCVSDGIDRNIAAGVLNGLGTTESPLRGMLTFEDGTGWGQVEQLTSSTNDAIDFDDVLDILPSALIDGYHANAKYIMRRQTFHKLIISKDSQGKYQIGNQINFFGKDGIPLDILGYPVMFDAGMPAVADGALAVMFGDFEAAYKKVNRIGFSIHRNDSNAKFVTLTGRKRVGGNVINFEAYKILKIQ